MTQSADRNRAVVLASRPSGAPTPANFRLQEAGLPTLGEGQLLLRTVFLSLDPYMRGRMNEGESYTPATAVGEVMGGGTVSRVERSNNEAFAVGEWVSSMAGWQDYSVSSGAGVSHLSGLAHPSWALGVFGMPGFTAYVGLLDLAQPRAGETVVVASATGAVGAVVGQLAKLRGCRVVGIAGGPEKCRSAMEELGLDECLDHYKSDLAAELTKACPGGIDVYFENVGGAVFEAVLPLLNVGARVPVCGLISQYNEDLAPPGPDRLPGFMGQVLTRRIKLQGFIVGDHYNERYGAFFRDMNTWVSSGAVRYREDVVEGLENAPTALIGLLKGENFGKLVVRVGHD
jgi:NADPH-dependent curcumin reductase CurA